MAKPRVDVPRKVVDDQRLADFGRTRCHGMQTIVTHRIAPSFEIADPCLPRGAGLYQSGLGMQLIPVLGNCATQGGRARSQTRYGSRPGAPQCWSGIGGSGSSNAPRWNCSAPVIGNVGQFDQREGGFRILLPDREVGSRHRQPAEPEHVAAGLGDASRALPGDLGDVLE